MQEKIKHSNTGHIVHEPKKPGKDKSRANSLRFYLNNSKIVIIK